MLPVGELAGLSRVSALAGGEGGAHQASGNKDTSTLSPIGPEGMMMGLII